MKTYDVLVSETSYGNVQVEAENEDEARSNIQRKPKRRQILQPREAQKSDREFESI